MRDYHLAAQFGSGLPRRGTLKLSNFNPLEAGKIKIRAPPCIAMADEDVEEERHVRRRRSRPPSGMIHHLEFTSAFEKALATTAAIYREEMLKGKLNAFLIQDVQNSLAHHFIGHAKATFMRLVMEEKDMDDDKAQLRWRRHRDVMLKVCKGKYEGARLPAYVVTSIRDLHQFPKLKALLAFSIIANHHHAQARLRKERVTIAPYEVEHFFSYEHSYEPESEAFFSEFNFDREVPALAAAVPVQPPPPAPPQEAPQPPQAAPPPLRRESEEPRPKRSAPPLPPLRISLRDIPAKQREEIQKNLEQSPAESGRIVRRKGTNGRCVPFSIFF